MSSPKKCGVHICAHLRKSLLSSVQLQAGVGQTSYSVSKTEQGIAVQSSDTLLPSFDNLFCKLMQLGRQTTLCADSRGKCLAGTVPLAFQLATAGASNMEDLI